VQQHEFSCRNSSVLNELFTKTNNLPVLNAAQVMQSNFGEIRAELRSLLELEQHSPGHLEISRHPNGFLKITLYRVGRRTVRLHLWTSGFGETHDEIRIHGHAWSLASIVLQGEIVHTLFQETSSLDGGRYCRYKYKSGTSDRPHSLRYDGTAYLKASLPQAVKPKEIYSMSTGQVHCSQATTSNTATLMFSDRESSNVEVPVYSKMHFPGGYLMDVPIFSGIDRSITL
jgi:hypothetical protein